MIGLRTATLVLLLTTMGSSAVAQDDGWYSLFVPGGAATLLTLEVDEHSDRASVMVDIIRRLHFSTQPQLTLEDAIKRLPLDGGGAIALPLPMSPTTWGKVIFGRTVPTGGLFTQILQDRSARLLFHGLAGMDAATRAWLERQPALLRSLYTRQQAAEAFAMFAPAVHIDAGAIVVAGGDAAARSWSAALGVPVTDPARFVSRLFLDRDGRVAALYFLAAFVDPTRRSFVIGESAQALSSLIDAFTACYPSQLSAFPFILRSADPAWLLLTLAVTEQGRLAGPTSQGFWTAVFAGDDLTAPRLPASGELDAAWVVNRLCAASAVERPRIFETLLAGNRVFASPAPGDMGDAVVALRVRRLFPAVFMAIERAGFRDPATFAMVGRGARRLARLNDLHSTPPVLQQFQGALALILGAVTARTLDRATGRQLMQELSEIPLANERYRGRVAAWFDQQLIPALRRALPGIDSDAAEGLVAHALAGPAPTVPHRVEWEDSAYVVDYSAWTRERLKAVRRKQGGQTLDEVLAQARNAKDARGVDVADRAFAAVLASWAYAPHVGDTDSRALLGGDNSRRHDLGVRGVNTTRFDQRWQVAVAPTDRGAIAGSYLSLESAMSVWSLRRLASDRIPLPPTIGDNDRASLISMMAFTDPQRLNDDGMHQIVAAIDSGTNLIEESVRVPASFQALADVGALSPWRRAAIPWMLVHEPDRLDRLFSLTVRARLGGISEQLLAPWGTSSMTLGCPCLQPPFRYAPELIVGRPVDGIVGSYSGDLALRVAQLLTRLHMPATLMPAVLAYALRDYVDGVHPAHPADTEAFTRQAERLTQTAVEDYLGAIAAVGPLRPATR